jgi:hypothetical protein
MGYSKSFSLSIVLADVSCEVVGRPTLAFSSSIVHWIALLTESSAASLTAPRQANTGCTPAEWASLVFNGPRYSYIRLVVDVPLQLCRLALARQAGRNHSLGPTHIWDEAVCFPSSPTFVHFVSLPLELFDLSQSHLPTSLFVSQDKLHGHYSRISIFDPGGGTSLTVLSGSLLFVSWAGSTRIIISYVSAVDILSSIYFWERIDRFALPNLVSFDTVFELFDQSRSSFTGSLNRFVTAFAHLFWSGKTFDPGGLSIVVISSIRSVSRKLTLLGIS